MNGETSSIWVNWRTLLAQHAAFQPCTNENSALHKYLRSIRLNKSLDAPQLDWNKFVFHVSRKFASLCHKISPKISWKEFLGMIRDNGIFSTAQQGIRTWSKIKRVRFLIRSHQLTCVTNTYISAIKWNLLSSVGCNSYFFYLSRCFINRTFCAKLAHGIHTFFLPEVFSDL